MADVIATVVLIVCLLALWVVGLSQRYSEWQMSKPADEPVSTAAEEE